MNISVKRKNFERVYEKSGRAILIFRFSFDTIEAEGEGGSRMAEGLRSIYDSIICGAENSLFLTLAQKKTPRVPCVLSVSLSYEGEGVYAGVGVYSFSVFRVIRSEGRVIYRDRYELYFGIEDGYFYL